MKHQSKYKHFFSSCNRTNPISSTVLHTQNTHLKRFRFTFDIPVNICYDIGLRSIFILCFPFYFHLVFFFKVICKWLIMKMNLCELNLNIKNIRVLIYEKKIEFTWANSWKCGWTRTFQLKMLLLNEYLLTYFTLPFLLDLMKCVFKDVGIVNELYITLLSFLKKKK